jgi:hypothetical protein
MYLHHLARYIVAGHTERRAIAQAAKYPSPARGGDAMTMGWDEDVLGSLALQEWWCRAVPGGDNDPRREQAERAGRVFEYLIDRVDFELERMDSCRSVNRWAPTSKRLAGVEIADSPVPIEEIGLDTEIQVGALSFSTSRARPHTEASLRQAAVVLWWLVRDRREYLSPELCIAVDLGNRRIGDAGDARVGDLDAAKRACAEIAAMWPEL